MTTVAYCAISRGARTFSDQLVMHEEVVPALRELADAVHAEGAAASIPGSRGAATPAAWREGGSPRGEWREAGVVLAASPPPVTGSLSPNAVKNGFSHFRKTSQALRFASRAGSSFEIGTRCGMISGPAL